MTTWQFHCPQCAGLFQIDSSYAGQTVGCPLCSAPVMLPPPESFAPQPQQPPPPNWPPQPMPGGEPLQLACPYCQGGFLVGPEMAGHDVACPHCHQGVTVPAMVAPQPMLPAPQPQLPPPPAPVMERPAPSKPVVKPVEKPAPATEQAFNSPPPTFLYPPGFNAPGGKSEERPAAPQPAPSDTAASRYPPGLEPKPKSAPRPAPAPAPVNPASLYPPGAAPAREPEKKAPASRPAPAPAPARVDPASLLPPGTGAPAAPSAPAAAPKSEAPRPAPAPAPAPAPQTKVESTPVRPSRSAIDDLLPPGAEEIDSLLPPGSGLAGDVALPSSTPILTKPTSDSLLPPGAGEVVTSGPMQQVALPDARQMAAASRPDLPLRAADGSVLIPTEDGRVLALREPVKTVGKGSNERELHVLPPEEKQRRRMIRSVIVFTVGIVLLVTVFMVLTRFG